ESYRELKRNAPVGMMVTSGEHHGTLQSFRTLSETGIDIMQPDVGWCGGAWRRFCSKQTTPCVWFLALSVLFAALVLNMFSTFIVLSL
ncbi:hypothetical protein AB2908_24720, partial [Escherichia coli]